MIVVGLIPESIRKFSYYVNFFNLTTGYRLMEEPTAYGKLGLANLLELREECLREFQFVDAYRSIKQR